MTVVFILGDNGEAIAERLFPNFGILSGAESESFDVIGIRKEIREASGQYGRQVLIEE